jgi:hypothetical protein
VLGDKSRNDHLLFFKVSSLKLMAVPMSVLKDVEIVRIAVASELYKRPAVAQML